MSRIETKLRKLLASDFSKNVLTLTTGTAIAQIIPLLIAPILSRIYTPEDFGRLALYLSIVSVISAIAGGRYELAILLPKERRKSIQITLLSAFIVLIVSLVSLLVVILFSKKIAIMVGDPKLELWLYFVPISIMMIGVFNALNYFNTREKHFKNIAIANVYKASGGGIIQLFTGLVQIVSNGLILGQIMSHLFGNIKMVKSFSFYKEEIKSTRLRDLKELARRYIDFPKYSVLGILLNTLSLNLINFFISIMYDLSSVGFYSYAFKYLGLPISLIANSIGQVYFQKMAELKSNKQSSIREFKKSALRLVLISLIIFCPLFFIIESFFAFIFGEQWRIAGEYAKFLIPLFGIRFVVSPLTSILVVIERQGKELLIHSMIMIASIVVWGIVYFYNMEIEKAIILYSTVLSILYFVIILFVFNILRNTAQND